MRRNVRILPILVIAVAVAGAPRSWAQNAPPQGQAAAPAPAKGQDPPIDPQKLAQVLALWEKNSANLRTLSVTIKRTDKSPAWDEDEHYIGQAILKSPNQAMLDFQKQVDVVDPKTKQKTATFEPHEKIVCTGTEVWQYKWDTKQIFIYPLEKEVQQRALEEGPLPFLFNFKAVEAQKRYQMALIRENANSYLIQIIPRLDIDKESFSKAWVVLDRRTFLLPSHIRLLSTEGKSMKDFEIKDQAANKPVPESSFLGKAIAGFKIVRNPGNEGQPAVGTRPAQTAPAPAPPAAPVQQPAMRPRGLFGNRRN